MGLQKLGTILKCNSSLHCVTRGHGPYFLAYRHEKWAYKNWAQFPLLVNHEVHIFCGGCFTIYGGQWRLGELGLQKLGIILKCNPTLHCTVSDGSHPLLVNHVVPIFLRRKNGSVSYPIQHTKCLTI